MKESSPTARLMTIHDPITAAIVPLAGRGRMPDDQMLGYLAEKAAASVESIRACIRMLTNGMRPKRTARNVGMSVAHVRRVARTIGWDHSWIIPSIGDVTVGEARALLALGMSTAMVAKHLGVSRQRVSQVIEDRDSRRKAKAVASEARRQERHARAIQASRRQREERRTRRHDRERLFMELWRAGAEKPVIAAQCGLRISSIAMIASRLRTRYGVEALPFRYLHAGSG